MPHITENTFQVYEVLPYPPEPKISNIDKYYLECQLITIHPSPRCTTYIRGDTFRLLYEVLPCPPEPEIYQTMTTIILRHDRRLMDYQSL